jgi:precorrin-2 dehydrogenase/sirohydrochlorin ferrochelatase
MGYYPVSLEVGGRPCVVVGGGLVAERKVMGLLSAGARVTVISPEATPGIVALAETHEVVHHPRAYRRGDLRGAFLAVAATDDRAVQEAVAGEAAAGHTLLNVVDRPALCSFILPAVFQRGPVTLAVSTGGASPALARRLRDDLSRHVGAEHAWLARILGALRERLAPGPARARLFEALLEAPVLERLRDGRTSEVDALLRSLGGPACALGSLGLDALDAGEAPASEGDGA